MIMTTISALSDPERRILAVLNEAGDEYVTTLANSVLSGNGGSCQVDKLIHALTNLHRRSLIEFADTRDVCTLTWIVLPTSVANGLVEKLTEYMVWSEKERIWNWSSTSPRLSVLLTNEGERLGTQILRTFGWSITQRP